MKKRCASIKMSIRLLMSFRTGLHLSLENLHCGGANNNDA